MYIYKNRNKRLKTGKKKIQIRKSRQFDQVLVSTKGVLGQKESSKTKVYFETISVSEKGSKKTVQEQISKILKHPSDQNKIKKKLLTKDSLLKVSSGRLVKVTSRPGRGTLSGIYVKDL